MKLNSNVLTFEQTNRFKGLLILLIVFGHISQIFENYPLLHDALYSFHVVSFLLLPFLFNTNLLTVKNIKKNLKRLYLPYSFFFLLSFIAYSLMEHQFHPLLALEAWTIGSAELLKMETGFRIFWFFPALMSSLLLIMFFNSLSKNFKSIFILLFIIGHLTIPFIPKAYLFYFPLSAYIPIYLFVIGLSVQYIYKNFNYHQYPTWLYSLLFIGLLYLAKGTEFSLATAKFSNILHHPFNFIVQDLIMIVSFFTLILWSKNIQFLELFGKYSLAIFTIHPFVIQLLNLIYNWQGLYLGIIKFFLVIIITFFLIQTLKLFNLYYFLYKK